MPDGFSKIAAPNTLTCAELVDAIALQDFVRAEADKARKELVAELLSRLDKDDKYVDGTYHTATVVAEGVVWSLDSERIKEQMGMHWYNRFSKHSVRKAYLKVTARKDRL